MDPISFTAGVQPALETSNFHKVKGERFMIYCNYPISEVKISRYKTAVFTVMGSPQEICDVHIVSNSKLKHSNFAVSQIRGKDEALISDLRSTDLMMEYQVNGGSTVKIKWS